MDEFNGSPQDELPESEEEYTIKNSAFIVISAIIGILLALWFTL
jgi:hypothetical protein